MKINNRRYTGSKYKLREWIKSLITENCTDCSSFFDVFGGTGIITATMLNLVQKAAINDFLYSNEICYKAFFGNEEYGSQNLKIFVDNVSTLDKKNLPDNYVSANYGDKYFNHDDAKLIGVIREKIQVLYEGGQLNEREFNILLASLLYSFDRCANTVGHYDAYIKKGCPSNFDFELIEPVVGNAVVEIYREDANKLARRISADVAFVDPPYNSRQYSRFYHVMETIAKWDKPPLSGKAMKPPLENMSEYCRVNAPIVFNDLIQNLNVRYIVVTYNNTYDSKSSSSRNKITLNQIKEILNYRGNTKIFEKSYSRFNAGKTESTDHKEYLFITEVEYR